MEKSESHIGIWLLAENSIKNSYRSMLKNTVHINNKEHHRLFQVHLNFKITVTRFFCTMQALVELVMPTYTYAFT